MLQFLGCECLEQGNQLFTIGKLCCHLGIKLIPNLLGLDRQFKHFMNRKLFHNRLLLRTRCSRVNCVTVVD